MRIYTDTNRLRIIVTGYVLRLPLGGNAWPYLQYVLGLLKLKHDVYYVEESGDSPFCCYDPERGCSDTNPSYGLSFLTSACDFLGIGPRWAYYDAHRNRWMGPCADSILELCQSADLLLRMPAITDSLRSWFERIPARVLIDIDPVFTQLRHLSHTNALRDADRYTAYFSFGENISKGAARVPDDGFVWRSTRPPIVLDAWPVTPGPSSGSYTTVMKWESYRGGEHGGVHYGMKSESFAPYMTMPEHVSAGLELAASGPDTPTALLRSHGWNLSNPLEVTRDLESYQRYIQTSKAEFSIAKHGYVISRSGWLSDRTGAYLASGRPAVVQDTGITEWMELGAGMIVFSNFEEAVEAIREIDSRYNYHCQKARELAEAYFDARKILTDLLESALDSTPD